jgi:hypothetical protein
MSFKAEIEALIANANSSLEDLEAVLRRAQSRSSQGDTPDASNGAVTEIQAQIDTIRQRILSSLLEIRESYNQDQARLSDLEGELKLDLENVRQCAIDYFIKGDYQGCERLLTFLAKIQPNDENLENFLELSRQKRLENELESPGAVADDQSLSKKGDREQRLADENQPVPGTPEAKVGRNEAEASFAAEVPLPLGPEAGPDSPRPVLPDPQETIEPLILAEIELKTAAHINEIYRTPPNSARPRFLVGAMAVALGLAMTFYWLSRSQPDGSIAESLSASQSRGEEVASPNDSLAGLRREAQELFDAGKLQEAGRVSEAILAKDPEDSFALSLKDYARASLAEPKAPAEEGVPSERTAQLQGRPVPPPEVRSDNVQFRTPSTASNAPLRPTLSTDRATLSINQKPSDQRPPELELTKQAPPAAASVAPAIPAPVQVASVPQIRPDQLLELNSRIQARDFDQARLLLGQLESGFPTNPEVRTLGERFRLEVQKQNKLVSSWIEKAEAAWIAGRYVTPPDDNVLVYCNQALKAEPKNQRATSLKKEIVQRAVAQAKDWIQRGKFDAARLTYASMDYLAAGDEAFPYSKQEVKQQLEKLGFRAYPMVHDHKLGSCSGILRFNAYAVSYVPSGGSGDGFAESLDSIVLNDEGDRLKITYRDRTFRFRSENGNIVGAIYQQLMTRMSDEKSTLATRSRDTR